MRFRTKLFDKFKESIGAVLPIISVVIILGFTIAPVPSGTMLSFLLGGIMLIVGMMFFSVGAEAAMEPMGVHVSASVTKTRKLSIILIVSFVLGILITISEPDLQVLAEQVQAIPNQTLILSVAFGVGGFLVLSLVRIFYKISLRWLLFACYIVVLVMVFLAPENFRSIAFDSGGVTTGPMTVPFIMSFGMGIAAIRSDSSASEDSFGLVALCSVGPILAVLVLSMIFNADGADYQALKTYNVLNTIELRNLFGEGIPEYLKEMLISILPITIVFFVLNIFMIRLNQYNLSRICVGLIYTYIGLTVFMTGANFGFMPAGAYLGQIIGHSDYNWIIVPVGVIIGYLVVKAEPAVYVLMHQVEDLTDGAITGRSLQISMCVGVGVSVGLSMLRVLISLDVLWFIIPGYIIALILSFISPKIFTAIAFDSGGVASGPMTAAFLLPMTMGCCSAVGGNMAKDAFGVVALVAMTPLITIQGLGILYRIRSRRKDVAKNEKDMFADLKNDAIIEL